MYSKGESKLSRELSVVSFVKMQRRLKIIFRLILTKQQQLLADYSKHNKISTSSGSSHSESPSDLHLPNMLHNSKVKLDHRKAVEKFFDEYLPQKCTFKDSNLLRLVYTSRPFIGKTNKMNKKYATLDKILYMLKKVK